jgi:hypothetical protein
VDTDALDPNRLEWAIFPILAGNTDMGVLLGAQVFLAKFDPGYRPYRWRNHTQIAASLKAAPTGGIYLPVHMDWIKIDLPGLAGGRFRLVVEVAYNQVVNSGYFGLGNASRIPPIPADPVQGDMYSPTVRRHQYGRAEPMIQAEGRLLLDGHLQLLTGLRLLYAMPEVYVGSALDRDRKFLRGLADHAALQAGLGLLWDTRDHETSPSRGLLIEASMRGSPGLGHALSFGGFHVNARAYQSIFGEYLVFAGRLIGDFLFGQVPFHELSRAGTFQGFDFPGGRMGLPGIPEGRYHGHVKVGANLELRSMFWPFRLFGQRLRLGALAFVGAGRVWADWKSDPERDGKDLGLKWGVGGGLRLQWGETIMIRGDVAFSPDAASAGSPVGIYLDAEHVF